MEEKDCPCSRREVLAGVGAVGLGLMLSGCDASVRDVVGDVSAGDAVDVDVSGIKSGEALTKLWKGKPVFIRHRTREEIHAAQAGDAQAEQMRDPEQDAQRVQRDAWIVVVGICPHLGCVPQGQKEGERRGKYGGWFCACHGTQYDTSGRLIEGPGPKNLVVPPYRFVSETVIRIGEEERAGAAEGAAEGVEHG